MKWGCALAGLMVGAMPAAAWAQDQAAPPAAPQDVPAPNGEMAEEEIEEVVVSGQLEGAVPGDVKPEQQLGPAEIRSYGASNLSELVSELSAQIGSGQGRGDEQPVILLSGRRSSMREIRDLPPEAVLRIDILPEEAALQYGYSANQKVINFVLRRRFAGLTTELEGRMPTAGGNAGVNGEANVAVIRRDERISLAAEYDQSTGILESERGVSRAAASLFDLRGNVAGIDGGEIDPALSAAAGDMVTVAGITDAAASGGAPSLADFVASANQPNVTDVTPYRTLVGPQKQLRINGSYARPLSDKVRATLSVELDGSENYRLLGLPSATLVVPGGNPHSPFADDVRVLRYFDGPGPLTRASSSRQFQGGLNLNGEGAPWAKSWNWTFEGSYRVDTSRSTTDRGIDPAPMQALLDAGNPAFNPFAPLTLDLLRARPADLATSRTSVGGVDMLTNGPLFTLPAGDARASVRVAARTQDFSSDSFRNGVAGQADFSRDSASLRGNVDLPITSRSRDVLGAVGDLSLNANFEVEQLSDFGRLTATGYGIRWAPVPQVRALLSWNEDSNAPNAGQLGDPVVITPNVRIFDYVRSESVDITQITGGNPLLLADDRHVFKAQVTIRPLSETSLDIRAQYVNQRYRNTSGAFPGPTAEVEAAFPDRFVRDATGRLVSVDYRRVNFDRYDHEELRWGFNLWLPISSPAQRRQRERFSQLRSAMEESRRTGQPLPPEASAQLEQLRRLGQQPTLFGDNQRGPIRRQPQEQAGEGNAEPARQAGEGQARPQPEGQGAEPGARRFGPGGGGGRGGFRMRGGGGSGVRLGLFHTWVLKDQRVIRAGLPVLDYLNGAGQGQSGGTPAHKISLQSAVQLDGYRLRLNGSWESGTEVTTGMLGSGDRLHFGSLAKLDLVAQADLGQQFDLLLKHPWLRGTRVSLRVDNLFDARQRVTDAAGLTPAAYHPSLLDPMGRTVRLSIRKQFF